MVSFFFAIFLGVKKNFFTEALWINFQLIQFVEITEGAEGAYEEFQFLYVWEKIQTTEIKEILPLS